MKTEISELLNRFQSRILDLFLLNKPEITFGIYGLINRNREKFIPFLTDDLSDFISHKLDQHNFSTSVRFQIEKSVYSYLLKFYNNLDDYDKHCQTNIREGEISLQWYGQNFYYIRSSKHLNYYSFRFDDFNIEFRINRDTENITELAYRSKRFLLTDEIICDNNSKLIACYFNYRCLTESEKKIYTRKVTQEIINEKLSKQLDKKLNPGNKIDQSRLNYLINEFTSNRMYDYYIRPELRKILDLNLDIFIKNYYPVSEQDQSKFKNELAGIMIFREIAIRLNRLLVQIEEFKTRLWKEPRRIKKSDYIISLSKIIEVTTDKQFNEFIKDLLQNPVQLTEWEKLVDVDIDIQTFNHLTDIDIIRTCTIDTKYFTNTFKSMLLDLCTKNDSSNDIIDGYLYKGDNWQWMNTISKNWKGKIKTIYIDPPYNTKSDEFRFRDKYTESLWLTMMKNRITISKELLSENGTVLISIDNNELFNLKLIMDMFYKNFIGLIISQTNPRGRNLDPYLAKTHEYLVVYSQSNGKNILYPKEKSERQLNEYNKIDENNQRYRLIELRNRNPRFTRKNRPNLYYPVYINKLGEVSLEKSSIFNNEALPKNSKGEDDCWTWGKEKFKKEINLLIGKQVSTGGWRVFRKDYLKKEGKNATTKERSIWMDKDINHENGKETLRSLFGDHVFSYPKSVEYLQRIISFSSDEGNIILDFFAGSGTTGHAVVNLNKKSIKKRKFILIENQDHFEKVLIPRLKKLAFSNNWMKGKPLDNDGNKVFYQYQVLEEFEEALNHACKDTDLNLIFSEEDLFKW